MTTYEPFDDDGLVRCRELFPGALHAIIYQLFATIDARDEEIQRLHTQIDEHHRYMTGEMRQT